MALSGVYNVPYTQWYPVMTPELNQNSDQNLLCELSKCALGICTGSIIVEGELCWGILYWLWKRS